MLSFFFFFSERRHSKALAEFKGSLIDLKMKMKNKIKDQDPGQAL